MKTLVGSVFFIFIFISFIYSQNKNLKIEQLISEGDYFAEKTFENQKALEKYLEALNLAPRNYELYWKISRCYVDIGEHLSADTPEEKNQQEVFYKKALSYADSAVQVNPKGSMGYTRRAIAYGRIALFKGIWDNIGIVKRTKSDLDKAIELDSNNATAYYVLARTHTKVSEKSKVIRWPLGLGWANLEDAIKYYEKAISLRPDFIMYRLDAAKAYIQLEDFAKAKKHLYEIASLPTQDEDDDNFRKEATELMMKIKNK